MRRSRYVFGIVLLVGGRVVVMELIVPEGQQWSEGVWIDYFDFFDD